MAKTATYPANGARAARERAGITLEQAAAACRFIGRALSPATLASYEAGRGKFPLCHTQRLANLYGCDYSPFCLGRNQANPKQPKGRKTKAEIDAVVTKPALSVPSPSRSVGTTERTVRVDSIRKEVTL